ncbi:MAG: hypothetical protein HQL56_12635, partial [Magnetococcales bacterium]|nr:hypothetical protein [Magnetococcales bacterium]
GLADGYRRYLDNQLRERFGLSGVPVRWSFRKQENPYRREGEG